MSATDVVRYDALRDDWIKGADLIVRLICRSATRTTTLEGFPRQWLPTFVYFGVRWTQTRPPQSYIPIASDLSEQQLETICRAAQSAGALRTLVECFAALDPLLADVLYKADRRISRPADDIASYLPLTGWQSYGRPEVLALNRRILTTAKATASTAVLLPCARKRPYAQSKTHRRIWRALTKNGVDPAKVDKLVVSSIGVVPEGHWDDPVVAAYDSGVPDIYRILRLLRLYFQRARYKTIIDCLEFKPYSDCVAILSKDGLVGDVRIARQGRAKSLPQP